MVLKGNFIFLAAESKPGYRDPNQTYYRALLMQGASSIEVGTTASLFNNALNMMDRFTDCECEFRYNQNYKSLQLVSICPLR